MPESVKFLPGTTSDIGNILARGRTDPDWGGLRGADSLFTTLEDAFVRLPSAFAAMWQADRMNAQLRAACEKQGIVPQDGNDNLFWLQIDLPENGDKSLFAEPFDLGFDCLLATNRAELAILKHTGGSRLVEIDIPVDIDRILEIVSVVDSSNQEYSPSHELGSGPHQHLYVLDERQDRLVILIDYTGTLDTVPNSITITYAVTEGTAANGIEPGLINALYESHPGISRVVNLTTTTGAIPAKSEPQILKEVSSRLRQRDRAMTFRDMADWTMTFDPRIKRAECTNGIERLDGLVRRCIIVNVDLRAEEFLGDPEVEELKSRLRRFLKSRSAANIQFKVKVTSV